MAIISTNRASYQRHDDVLGHKSKKPKPVCPPYTRDSLQAVIADAKLVLQATTENVFHLRLSRLKSRLKQL